MQGAHSDTELDETGRNQAQKIANALVGAGITAIYSSPLQRALQTAQPLAQRLDLKVEIEPALLEIDTGQADGLPVAHLKEKYPHFWQDWVEGANSLRWPGGESLEELGSRTQTLLERLRLQPGGVSVALVGHTFSLLVLLLQTLGLELGLFRRLRLEVACISILELGERADTSALLNLNDTCHWK